MRRSLLALFLFLLALPALAALARPVSVETLAREADAVVEGTVESRVSRWADDGRHIYTLVTLRASRVWRGSAPAQVVLRVPGGVVGDIGQHVDAAAEFSDGERVVVFLKREDGGRWLVHGMGQGKFSVTSGLARPSLRDFTFTQESVAAGERRVEAMPAEELERRVRSAR